MTISHLSRITVVFFDASKRPAESETAEKESIVCVIAIGKPAKGLSILTLGGNIVNAFYFCQRVTFESHTPLLSLGKTITNAKNVPYLATQPFRMQPS